MKKIPVLFIIFNREELSLQTFNSIKAYKPYNLYIAADGPRNDRINEDSLCKRTRKKILEQIDWECKIHTRFLDYNLGCGRNVSSAITWFFNQEKYGVIIEDDCSPVIEFFHFCEELLPKYENEEKIMQINGFNPIASGIISNKYSFSRYPKIWGWATWRRAWNNFDIEMKNWKEYRNSKRFWKHFPFFEAIVHRKIWDSYIKELNVNEKPRTWDFQWSVSIFSNEGLCIVPFSNLIVNTGEGVDATNCTVVDSQYKGIKYGKMNFPLQHPSKVTLDPVINKIDSKAYMSRCWRLLKSKIKSKIF